MDRLNNVRTDILQTNNIIFTQLCHWIELTALSSSSATHTHTRTQRERGGANRTRRKWPRPIRNAQLCITCEAANLMMFITYMQILLFSYLPLDLTCCVLSIICNKHKEREQGRTYVDGCGGSCPHLIFPSAHSRSTCYAMCPHSAQSVFVVYF